MLKKNNHSRKKNDYFFIKPARLQTNLRDFKAESRLAEVKFFLPTKIKA